MSEDDGRLYERTVRELLPETDIIGQRIIGVTQHDKEEYRAGELGRIELLLEGGSILTFYENGDFELARPDGHVTTLGLPRADDDAEQV